MAYPELDRIVREWLAATRGPGFGIVVLDAAPNLSAIDVEVRFLAGRRYFCMEPGCHLPWQTDWLIREAAGVGVPLPSGVVVRWHCRVEQGAELECNEAFGLPLQSEAQEYEWTTPPVLG